MSAPYVLTPEAQAHIDEIGGYIAQDSGDSALRVYDAFQFTNADLPFAHAHASIRPVTRFYAM